MNILKKFRLGSLVLKVSRRRHVPIINGCPAVASFEAEKNLIWIHPDDPSELESFFHEFFHAAFHDSGVKQAPGWSQDIEEILCEKLSRYIAEYVKQQKRSKK